MATYISGNGIRPGYVILFNGKLHKVMKAEHRTPGNKRAFCQAKLRNLETGLQCTAKFRGDENVERAELEQVEMEYLYEDPSGFCFMNCETFDQIFIGADVIEQARMYLLPNTKLFVEFHEERAIGVSLPETVSLEVTETAPGLKGATASGSGKPATLETGLVVTVPQFVNVGEVVRVTTSTGEYLERVKK